MAAAVAGDCIIGSGSRGIGFGARTLFNSFRNITFILLLLLAIISIIGLCESKQHHRRFSCSTIQQQERCPVHKHKICGSDGKLYPSRCHLRRAACDSNTLIRPAHPDQCLRDEENDDTTTNNNNNNSINNDDDDRTSVADEDVGPAASGQTAAGLLQAAGPTPADSFSSSSVDSSSASAAIGDQDEECHPKQYDLMKEKVLEKINDVSLLFARLDENSDGQITLNELWKHSMIYKSPDSVCLLTDLMQHEDVDDDDKLDYTEFQTAFNKLFSVSMVTLDESLAINKIEAHLGDNVEIRCDITGEPQKPAIKWFRHGVDLATLAGLPSIKVFNDGSLYLTDLRLSFSGNYSCQAVNNPTVKQIHIVDVIVDPIVEVTPRFQWTPIGGVASFECRFETFEDDFSIHWFKNDEQLLDGPKVTIINNGTLLQVAALEQTDTGAYTCRVSHNSGAFGQSVASLLVQDESVESVATSAESRPQRLWIFHANGLTIYEGICGQTIHEIDGRDIIYQNSLTLCGNPADGADSAGPCEWSDDVVQLNGLLYIAQPNLNRILVLHQSQLSVAQVIATDPQPRRLKLVEADAKEPQIWILCDGNRNVYEEQQPPAPPAMPSKDQPFDTEWKSDHGSVEPWSANEFFQEKYLKNRKTIQVVRLMNHSTKAGDSRHVHRRADVIHLQPVDGHFDLVYDLFMPDHYDPVFKNEPNDHRIKKVMQDATYAYAAHWEERSLIKISIDRFEYLHSIRLADCQPIAASIITRKAGGLVAVQCQTPITHQLNGQLILDQVTDAILVHNSHLNAHKSYLSPDHRYLVSIYHDFSNASQCSGGRPCPAAKSRYQPLSTSASASATNTSTIIVQKITNQGVEFLYDVRTSLDIVNCVFVWKNGNYDLVLASGTPNREDLLYLSLMDGHVELISGIGRPTEGYHRGMALSQKNRVLSITATESVYTVDLITNRILCESNKHFQKPKTMIWTN